MSEEALVDDQSHYEVSLTAGQAFLAFVLLLLSLAASFAFGLIIGRGQNGDDRNVASIAKQPAVINEASAAPKKSEVAVRDDDFKSAPAATITEESQPVSQPSVTPAAQPVEKVPATLPKVASTPAPAPKPEVAGPAAPAVPHYAQLLSTSDQKTAESLAAKVIEGGFTSAYVERGTSAKGPVYRVRVRFASETEARAAETKLRTFSKDVWITK